MAVRRTARPDQRPRGATLSAREVAARSGVSAATIRRWARAGVIGSSRDGRGRYRFDRPALALATVFGAQGLPRPLTSAGPARPSRKKRPRKKAPRKTTPAGKKRAGKKRRPSKKAGKKPGAGKKKKPGRYRGLRPEDRGPGHHWVTEDTELPSSADLVGLHPTAAMRIVGEAMRLYIMTRPHQPLYELHARTFKALKDSYRQAYGKRRWRQEFTAYVDGWDLDEFIFYTERLRDS